MKKQKEFSGAKALQFVDNVESVCAEIESHCSRIWTNEYVAHTDLSEFFQNALSRERQENDRRIFREKAQKEMLNFLMCYHHLNCDQVRTREDAEHRAYRIALSKFADRIGARYGIEL